MASLLGSTSWASVTANFMIRPLRLRTLIWCFPPNVGMFSENSPLPFDSGNTLSSFWWSASSFNQPVIRSAPLLKEVIQLSSSIVTMPSAIDWIKISNQSFACDILFSTCWVLMRLFSNACASSAISVGWSGQGTGVSRSPWLILIADVVNWSRGVVNRWA